MGPNPSDNYISTTIKIHKNIDLQLKFNERQVNLA